MQLKGIEPISVVDQIRCDRCDKEVHRSESDFEQMTSIGFHAGYGSIFGDGIPRQLTAEYIEEHGDKIILCEYNATRAHWTEPRDISIEELVHRYCSPNFTEVCKHVYNGTQSPFVHVFRLDGSTERVHLPANRSKHFC